ncbi:MAG: glutamate decarboxylase [bacterium]|nr:glutamate decarboxylase [bacterium]
MKWFRKKKSKGETEEKETNDYLSPTYGGEWDIEPIPKNKIPEHSLDPRVAYRLVADELGLDGNPLLNLATFVTTWMDPHADRLISEAGRKNLVDQDEYPQLKVIEDRIIQMEANLFNAPADGQPTGVTTIGSSEAIMLALLAHKWKWRKRRQQEGKDTSKPNLICGADVHTCWEKFGRYFDVEMRVIPLAPDTFTLKAESVAPLIDENTIAVGAVVGTTFTGQVDDVTGLNQLLLRIKEEKGWDIPIHVDAASGGFILPFVMPDCPWDFRLEQVRTINVSNHKFGLVYAGMGSVVFRDASDLPEELPFDINYLGGTMKNYSLNFSKSSSIMVAQYFQFLRLGLEGYKKIMESVMANAKILEERLLSTGKFKLLTDSKFLPVVVVQLKDDSQYSAYDVSDELRKYGWITPAYSLPPNAQDTVVLRMVVKENFSRDLADKLFGDIEKVIKALEQSGPRPKRKEAPLQGKLKSHGVC